MKIFIVMARHKMNGETKVFSVLATRDLAETVRKRCMNLDERHFYYINDDFELKNDLE